MTALTLLACAAPSREEPAVEQADTATEDTAVPPLPPPAGYVTAGWDFLCALDLDGRAVCWGDGVSKVSPVPDVNFALIDAGISHVCGLTVEGELLCWGEGDDVAEAPAGHFRTVSVLGAGPCALDEAGYATCWPEYRDQVVPPDIGFDALSDGKSGVCTLTDRQAECYCLWDDCQIRPVPSGPFASVATGTDHACALDYDGVPTCWGGYLDTASPPEGVRFSVLAAGEEHTCGITLEGGIRCWAWFGYEGLEPGGDEATRLMYTVPEDGFEYTALSLGGGFGIALDVDGQIHAFGSDVGGSYADALEVEP